MPFWRTGGPWGWNRGLDENIAWEELEKEKEELGKLDHTRKKLEKEKDRLLGLQQQDKEEGEKEYMSEGEDDM